MSTRRFRPAKKRSVMCGNIIMPKVMTIQRESQSCQVQTPLGPGMVKRAGLAA